MQQGNHRPEGDVPGRWEGLRKSIGGYVYGTGTDSPEGRVGRRQRLTEYVRAANELRQSYYAPSGPAASPKSGRWSSYPDSSSLDQPSNQELMEYVANGKEEIVLFPSYGRRRIRGQTVDNSLEGTHDPPGSINEGVRDEDIEADVDIRGWIYTPHTAMPPSRKNRVVMSMMAKLCGLPALPSPNISGTPSQESLHRTNTEQEAAQALAPGSPSPGQNSSSFSTLGSAASKLAWIGSRLAPQQGPPPQNGGLTLSRSEVEKLHDAMQTRLSPFLTTPAFQMPLTVFLYNNTSAQSTTLRTDNLGHFAIRKPLPFFPTHVRVLAGEALCAEEEIKFIDPESGISVISDIDDTIKISGIGMGLREMFRSVFTRDMAAMPVPGVADWFNSLAAPPLNAQIHYLSNSPWQLYPFLKELLIGHMKLPRGTWHLKKYSGFVQGIFEPVAERKKESLEGLMRDFPGRKWILVGDGGEGDLEVYTDVVKRWPGKVIAVYIRDVSGIGQKGFGTSPSASSQEDFFSGNMSATIPSSYQHPKVPFDDPPVNRSNDRLSEQPAGIRLASSEETQFLSRSGQSDTRSINIPKKIPPVKPPKPKELKGNDLPRGGDGENNLIDLGDHETVDRSWTPSKFTSSLYDGHEYGTPSPPRPRAPPPPRRPTNMAMSASQSYQTVMGSEINASTTPQTVGQSEQPKILDKKAELWKKRWEYADDVLDQQGILLRSWRVGKDVQDECVALAKAYLGL